MTDYVIIGNGVAGTTAAENIRKRDKDGVITIFSDEEVPFYWRIRLNEFISGEIGEGGLTAKKKDWYRENAIDLRLGTAVVGADVPTKTLFLKDGGKKNFERLLVATGSRSFVPPIKGSEKQGVFTLRSFRDAKEIAAWAAKTKKAVIIGGGLLGLEAGNALRKLGVHVHVVEFFPRLLPRQLDVEGAARLQGIMEGMGFSFSLGAKTSAIAGGDSVDGVELEGGERIPCKMVIISAGVRPDTFLAEPLGLEKDKGIKVDESMRTNREGIFAAGDVAEFKGMAYGIWPAAMEQGRVAGINMAGGKETYRGTTLANTLKVVGIDLASAGDIDADGKHEAALRVGERLYKKLVFEGDRIIGCIMLGDTKGFTSITKLMGAKKDISRVKDRLLDEGFDFSSVA
jgi:nitrite reductase (NADH) large subunit